MLLDRVLVDVWGAGDEVLLLFQLPGHAAGFGVEVAGEVVEQNFYGLAFCVPEFPLVVDFETLSVELQNFLYFQIQVVFEEVLHVPFDHLHKHHVLDENA